MHYTLRELSRSDLPAMTKWRNDPDVIDQLGSPFRFIDHEVDLKWFDAYLASRMNNVRLAICEMESGKIIGATHLLGIDWINRSADFGIWIGNKESQGHGAGEFATRGILKHAFLDLHLHRIALTVVATNERAIGLYKKIGFVEEGRMRQVIFKHGKYVDMIQMAILSNECPHMITEERKPACP